MSSEVNPTYPRASASLYLVLSLGLGALAFKVYLSGYYQAILLPTLLTPIFIALGSWRWHTANRYTHDPAAVTALLALGLLLLFQPETSTNITQWHWIAFCYPLLAFYLLPTALSLAFCLLLLAGLLHLRLHSHSIEDQLTFSGQFLLLMFIACFYAISNLLKIKQLEHLVGLDKVTGFFNRRHLTQRLNAEVSRARATKKPLALLLVELNQYPEIQKELGQLLADNFIREASKLCKLNCRTGDEAYRYDEQTLLLLIPNTTINGALVLRSRLYQHLLQELTSDLGPLDVIITPLELQIGEQVADLEMRIANSCYHSLSDRVEDKL
ncbi:GGDEF domain-containing protein [Marinospirillum insulare]|uniref:diguanylate cyclase n=1 Tax=Marinospirillum insulare TaxID=217169 RepID=A0ABQ5ZTA6_9GAMM|nr:GGDEF domain-containing protein [Marinospirillum insulare]GLR62666.1 hypothetical protein GCM10007878_01010 [Marinospirillum insulare]